MSFLYMRKASPLLFCGAGQQTMCLRAEKAMGTYSETPLILPQKQEERPPEGCCCRAPETRRETAAPG